MKSMIREAHRASPDEHEEMRETGRWSETAREASCNKVIGTNWCLSSSVGTQVACRSQLAEGSGYCANPCRKVFTSNVRYPVVGCWSLDTVPYLRNSAFWTFAIAARISHAKQIRQSSDRKNLEWTNSHCYGLHGTSLSIHRYRWRAVKTQIVGCTVFAYVLSLKSVSNASHYIEIWPIFSILVLRVTVSNASYYIEMSHLLSSFYGSRNLRT